MILRAEIVAYRSNTEVVPSSTFLHSAFFYRLNDKVHRVGVAHWTKDEHSCAPAPVRPLVRPRRTRGPATY
jgi:hypothetical protein